MPDRGADVLLADRVVEVLHNAGDAAQPLWNVGSGFVMRDRIVLTAAHNVSETGQVLVRRKGVTKLDARVCRLPSRRPAIDAFNDIALVEVVNDVELDHCPAIDIARLRVDATLRTPNLDNCIAWGFPRFQQKVRPYGEKPLRESVRIDGYIPMGEGVVEQLATLRIPDAPQDAPIPGGDFAASPWQGISGAVVFAGRQAVGIVSEHHLAAGINGLTVVPLGRIDSCPDSGQWWEMLGVSVPDALPLIPADDRDATALTEEAVLERYRHMVARLKDLSNVTAPFGLVPTDLYIPRLLRPAANRRNTRADETPSIPVSEVVRSTNPLIVVGDAGAGKTELLHDIARSMLDGDCAGTPVLVRLHDFATRANNRDLLTFSVEETLGNSLGPDELARTTAVLRDRAGEDGDLVYLFDGFDEVPVNLQDDVITQVKRIPRFILTSRPTGIMDTFHNVAEVYELAQLHDLAVAQFVESWTAHYPDTEGLRDALTADPALAELVTLPQLLILLCWRWQPGDGAATHHSKMDILRQAVDGALDRAKRLTQLPSGAEEDVPFDVRRALGTAALFSLREGDGRRLTVSRDQLLALMADEADKTRAGMLLAFARRSGLIVPAGRKRQDFQFVHQEFRSYLAGEAIAEQADPAGMIESLKWRWAAEDALAVATAADPERMPELLIRRLHADGSDIFRMDWRLVAICMSGLENLSEYEDMLTSVIDAVFAAATDWWSRTIFAPVLGMLRTEYTWRLLLDRVDSDEPYERWAAVEGLGHFADPGAVAVLAERLPVETWSAVRGAIIDALGRLRDDRAVPALVAHFRTGDERFATEYAAVGASLARLGATSELREVIAMVGTQPGVVDLLSGALPFLDEQTAGEVRKAFSQNGITLNRPEEIERYLQCLYDDSAAVDDQLNAISGLADIATEDVAIALCDTLADNPDCAVRDSAAQVVARFDGEVSFDEVVALIVGDTITEGENTDRAAAAFLSLWNSPSQSDLAALFAPEEDFFGVCETDLYRCAATAVIGALTGHVPAQVLVELVHAPDAHIREAAVAAVGRFGITDGFAEVIDLLGIETDLRVRAKCLEALAQSGRSDIVGILIASLDAADPGERVAAVESLATTADRRCTDNLVDRLNNERSTPVREALIRALAELCGAEPAPANVREALIRLLDSDDERIRSSAARAIADVRIAEPAHRLARLMQTDPSESVRGACARAYGCVAPLDSLLDLVYAIGGAAEIPAEPLAALAYAVGVRDVGVGDALRQRIHATGGATLATDRKTVIKYPRDTYTLHLGPDTGEHDTDALLASLSSDDPALRWDATDELAKVWEKTGVLGRLGLAMFDENICVAGRAREVLEELSNKYQLDRLDDQSVALLGKPENIHRLLNSLDFDDDRSQASSWLLAQPEFLPPLLYALANGNEAVRPTLWEVAQRYGLRLLPDRRAVLPSTAVVAWDDLPIELRR